MSTQIHQPSFGDIFYARLSENGNIQGGTRPVIISQNDMANKYSPLVTVIPLTSRINKASHLPVHVVIAANAENGLERDSVALAEQTKPISKVDLIERIGSLQHDDLVRVGKAVRQQMPFPL